MYRTKFSFLILVHFQETNRKNGETAFQKVVGNRNLPTIVVNGKFWGTESQLHRFEAKGTLEEELTKIGLLP